MTKGGKKEASGGRGRRRSDKVLEARRKWREERGLFLGHTTGHCCFWAAHALHPLGGLCPLGLSEKPVTPVSI